MSASILIFSGPSLTPSDMAMFPDLTFLPPIAQGDLFKHVGPSVSNIGIIDGYFGDRLSIFHKEILWAMAQGTSVSGAASMGALRAAELHGLGMFGVGHIFESYQCGDFTSDADVAVAHGPAELDYMPTSISQVDVKATVSALTHRGRLSGQFADQIIAASRAIFFANRTWTRIAEDTKSHEYSSDILGCILEGAHIQQKRLDAIELLEWVSYGSPRRDQSSLTFAPPATSIFRKSMVRAGLANAALDDNDKA